MNKRDYGQDIVIILIGYCTGFCVAWDIFGNPTIKLLLAVYFGAIIFVFVGYFLFVLITTK
jgi:hypothetical protein